MMAGRKSVAAASKPKSESQPEAASPVDALFDNFLPYLITRLAYRLNSDLVEKLRREEINLARWRILAVLAMGDGVTISEIIDRAMMQQSALSRVLMKMEAEHYVVRVPRSDDARYVEVCLTDKGRTLFEALDPVVRRRQERLLDGFSPAEAEAAFSLIRRLTANLKA
jgi:DNA-binding MarR family transcriptional regulator